LAEEEVTKILEQLDELRPAMFDRLVDKYDTYGSIYQYESDKFLANLAKNYGQFVEAITYNDAIRIKVKGIDVMNVVLMLLKISGVK